MDIISHGLYGWVVFGNKNKKDYRFAAGFWILPDFVSFGVPFAVNIITLLSWGDGSFFGESSHHNINATYIHTLYNITHSLIIRWIVFGALRLIFKRPIKASYARLLHILIDIPTHTLAFFATPFLRPLSTYRFDGIRRSDKMIFIPNIILLVVLYSIYIYKKYRKAKKIK